VQTATDAARLIGAGQKVTAIGGYVFNGIGAPGVNDKVRLFTKASDASCTVDTKLIAQDVVDATGFYYIWRTGMNQHNNTAPSLPSGMQYAVQLCSGSSQLGLKMIDSKLGNKEFEQVLYVTNVEPRQSSPSPTPARPPRETPTPRSGDAFRHLIVQAAARYALAPGLVESVIRVESNFEPRAVSSKGARGLMQLMPGTAKLLGVRDVFDAGQNIDGGVHRYQTIDGAIVYSNVPVTRLSGAERARLGRAP